MKIIFTPPLLRRGQYYKIRAGFTLLEIIVTISILTILFGAALGMFNLGNLSWDTHNIQLDLQRETRRGMEKMLQELYQTTSNQITVDTINNRITFKVPVVIAGDESNPQDIYDAQGNIRWGANGSINNSIRYSRSINTSQLIREIIDGSGAVVSSAVYANNVGAIVFTPVPLPPALPDRLSIKISCQKPLRPGSTTIISTDLQSQVTFRN